MFFLSSSRRLLLTVLSDSWGESRHSNPRLTRLSQLILILYYFSSILFPFFLSAYLGFDEALELFDERSSKMRTTQECEQVRLLKPSCLGALWRVRTRDGMKTRPVCQAERKRRRCHCLLENIIYEFHLKHFFFCSLKHTLALIHQLQE